MIFMLATVPVQTSTVDVNNVVGIWKYGFDTLQLTNRVYLSRTTGVCL